MNAEFMSTSNEWYTPPEIIEAVREVLGTIDLDPCSCAKANETVQATTYLTKGYDSLSNDWRRDVTKYLPTTFVNPPAGRVSREYLLEEWGTTRVGYSQVGHYFYDWEYDHNHGWLGDGIFLLPDINHLQTIQGYSKYKLSGMSLCVPSKRIKFICGNGTRRKSPPHANAILYVGDNPKKFAKVFEKFGVVFSRVEASYDF